MGLGRRARRRPVLSEGEDPHPERPPAAQTQRRLTTPRRPYRSYFTLRFDCNPPTLSALTTRLRLDPSVLRYTTLKLGSTLDAVAQDPRARGGNRTVRFAREAPPEPVLQGAETLGARGGMPGQFEGATLDDAREVMRQQQQSAAGGATAPLRRRSFQEL